MVKERPCELGGRGTIDLNRFGGKGVFTADFDNLADDTYNKRTYYREIVYIFGESQ